jgi:hypothetical protein
MRALADIACLGEGSARSVAEAFAVGPEGLDSGAAEQVQALGAPLVGGQDCEVQWGGVVEAAVVVELSDGLA